MACIFCQIVAGDAPSWKVLESQHAFAFLDINPVARYHTLVIPKVHSENIFEIGRNDLLATMDLVREVCQLYQQKLGIQNQQVVSSNGSDAQQDVFHSHWHIVPRSRGDGQSIRWSVYPELRSDFDQMLKDLR